MENQNFDFEIIKNDTSVIVDMENNETLDIIQLKKQNMIYRPQIEMNGQLIHYEMSKSEIQAMMNAVKKVLFLPDVIQQLGKSFTFNTTLQLISNNIYVYLYY